MDSTRDGDGAGDAAGAGDVAGASDMEEYEALLVAGRADHAELEELLRALGYQPVLIRGAEQMAGLRDPVSRGASNRRNDGKFRPRERVE